MVEIDAAHAKLIHGLVAAHKPERILEFGFGGGRSHHAIAAAAVFNQNKPHYTLVDNWLDWGGEMPEAVHASIRVHSLNHKTKEKIDNTFESYTVVTANEEDFVRDAVNLQKTYGFIMSDADHQRTHEWAAEVFNKLLEPYGFLIYHDVDGSYPGLGDLAAFPMEYGFMPENCNHMVFQKSTRSDEECKRGLLVIQKL